MAAMIDLAAVFSSRSEDRVWPKAIMPDRARTASLDAASASICHARPDQLLDGSLYCDGSLMVVANARIDRADVLRSELGQDASELDGAAALIAAAWRRWGSECPLHLFGDYAFFIHDSANGQTFCARDHIGARPLFYTADTVRLACASSLKILLKLPNLSPELDDTVVASSQLVSLFGQNESTFYHGIRRLPAGHCLQYIDGHPKITRWWRPEHLPERKDISDDDALSETRRLLEHAVSDRLAGSHNFACHLSGGIDSSLVAALAAPLIRARGDQFEIGYSWQDTKNADSDEAQWIGEMQAHLNLRHEAPSLDATELAALLAADWTKGPNAGNLFHEGAIQRDAARSGIDAILSGWGGDEVISFSGRGHRQWLLATGRWLELWRDADGPKLRDRLQVFYGAARRLWLDFKPAPSHLSRTRLENRLVSRQFARTTPVQRAKRIQEFGHRATMLTRLRDILITSRIEDWAVSGAKRGLTYLYPLLDRRLLEFVLTLPPRMFRRQGVDRWLAREVARGLLPELIRTNTSKDEPQRTDQLRSALADAFGIISQRLDQQVQPPKRARYFDMKKVRRHLDEVKASGSGQDKALRHAIQLLDFE